MTKDNQEILKLVSRTLKGNKLKFSDLSKSEVYDQIVRARLLYNSAQENI